MPAHRVRRKTQDGKTRWAVRAVIGGRPENGGRVLHLGVFATAREADAAIEWANMELAQGRVPDRRKRLVTQLESARTLRDEADAWLAGRVDLAESSRASYARIIHQNTGSKLALWRLRPTSITPDDVQRFIAQLSEAGAAPRTVARNLAVISQVLDHARVDPNPARDRRVKLPRLDETQPDPPTATQVAAILHALPKHYRLPVALLEATGMRVGELVDLRYGDVDFAESRFRIAKGKTRAARRFVDVPDELMSAIMGLVPFDERRADQRVFRVTRGALAVAMRRACQAAGIPLYGPHSLRHRYASRRIAAGESVLVVQHALGHTKASLTADVYGHIVVDLDEGWRLAHDAIST